MKVSLVKINLKVFSIFLCISQCLFFSETKRNFNKDAQNWSLEKIYKKSKLLYTQGLFFEDANTLVESGGLYGESDIKKWKLPKLDLLLSRKTVFPRSVFAEGIGRCGDTVYQLTWRERNIYKYNLSTLEELAKLSMPNELNEGWGLSDYKESTLIATDGSEYIYFFDCKNFTYKSKISVKLNGKNVKYLNDLAYANGYIYANVYFQTQILKIDPNSGNVEDIYEMRSLIGNETKENTLTQERLMQGDVLNGIAYRKETDTFFVTGKKWGFFYEVKFK